MKGRNIRCIGNYISWVNVRLYLFSSQVKLPDNLIEHKIFAADTNKEVNILLLRSNLAG